MSHRATISLVACALALIAIIAFAVRRRATDPNLGPPSSKETATRESGGLRPGTAQADDRSAATGGRANRQTGTIEEAWAALRSVEARLLSNEDPDLWIDDLVALEKSINFLHYDALAVFVRTARDRIDPKVADWLLPALYIAVGRGGRARLGEIDALLGERIPTESPKTLWGIAAGLAAKGYRDWSDEKSKEFWLEASFYRPLVRDIGYFLRHKSRLGHERIDDSDGSLIPGTLLPESLQPGGRPDPMDLLSMVGGSSVLKGTATSGFTYLETLLDRIERIPKGELFGEEELLRLLPDASDEMAACAGKWAKDKDMHSSFRVWGIEKLGEQDLDQALALARERIVQGDEDPTFRIGMADWLYKESYASPVNAVLVDSYFQQKADGTLMPRLIRNAVADPTPGALRVAQDVFSSVSDQEAQSSAIDGLAQPMWGKAPELAADRQSVLIMATTSPYEEVRAGAVRVLANGAGKGHLPDVQTISKLLGQMSEEDPSQDVRREALSGLSWMADLRRMHGK